MFVESHDALVNVRHMNHIVTVQTDEHQVAVRQGDARVLDVFGREFHLVVNNEAEIVSALLAEPAVSRDALGYERLAAFVPSRRAVELFCEISCHKNCPPPSLAGLSYADTVFENEKERRLITHSRQRLKEISRMGGQQNPHIEKEALQCAPFTARLL